MNTCAYITADQPETKSNLNRKPTPNPTNKHYAVVSIQL